MIDIGACFSYGIEKLKQNPGFYIGGMLIVAGVSIMINLIAQGFSFLWGFAVGFLAHALHMNETMTGIIAALGGALIGVILGFLLAPVLVGYFKGIRKDYEGGRAEIGDIFSAFSITVPCIINYAVANLVVVLGFICCIIPGFLVLPLVTMTVFFLAKDQVQGLTSFKSSVELLKKNPIIILWYIVLNIFACLGLILCLVGVFITAPIAMAAMYKMFQQALGEGSPVPAQPVAQN